MASGETGFDDVTVDLVSARYHVRKARPDIRADSQRAQRCHDFLARLSGAAPARR